MLRNDCHVQHSYVRPSHGTREEAGCCTVDKQGRWIQQIYLVASYCVVACQQVTVRMSSGWALSCRECHDNLLGMLLLLLPLLLHFFS